MVNKINSEVVMTGQDTRVILLPLVDCIDDSIFIISPHIHRYVLKNLIVTSPCYIGKSIDPHCYNQAASKKGAHFSMNTSNIRYLREPYGRWHA